MSSAESRAEYERIVKLLDDPRVAQEEKLMVMDELLEEMSFREDLPADVVVEALRLLAEIGIGDPKRLQLMQTVLALRQEGINMEDVIIH